MGFHSVLKIYKAKELNAFFRKAESPNKYYYLYSNSILPKNMLGEILKLSQGLFISFFPTNK